MHMFENEPDVAVETSSGEAGGGESAPGGDAGGGAAAPTDTGVDWNGELESLDEQDFYKLLPEDRRAAFRKGYSNKLGQWQKGLGGKMEELAQRGKDLDARAQQLDAQETQIREDERKWLKWMTGDEMPTDTRSQELAKENDRLTNIVKGMKAELDDLRVKAGQAKGDPEATAEVMQELTQLREAAKQAQTERAELESLRTWKTEYDAIEQAQSQRLEREIKDWLADTNPDIEEKANPDAWQRFVDAIARGDSVADAVAWVRVKFPSPKGKAEPEPLDDGTRSMHIGPSSAGTQPNESADYFDVMRKKERELVSSPS